MKSHSTRNPVVGCGNKVMPLAAFAFFLCLTTSHAQNTSTGDAYGNNINGTSITSVKNGTTDLTVLNSTTTKITLNRTVNGFISISNNFSTFDIEAEGGVLNGSNTTTLAVNGGSLLNINGGTFSGGTYTLTTNDWLGSTGGIFSNVETALVSSAVFQGKTIVNDGTGSGGPPLPGEATSANASGSSGLVIQNADYAELTDSTISGGSAGVASGQDENILAIGGTGLELYSSTMVISNTTITGGAGGQATASGIYSAYASGGNAIYATNSTLEIKDGSFSGAAAGEGTTKLSQGGSGLLAVGGSSITNHSGSFSGADAPAVQLENSHLTSFGGDYNGGGLYSATTGSSTNNLNLLGGTFSTLELYNASSNGIQFLTSSNIAVTLSVYQEGGTVDITNLDDDAFQDVTINGGTMIFNEDMALAANSSFVLSDESSKAEFQALEIGSGALVDIGMGTIEADGDIDVLSEASLNFQIITNKSGLISSTGRVTFGSNSTVNVDATLAGFSTGSSTSTIMMAAGGITTNIDTAVEVILTDDTSVTGRTSLAETLIGNDFTFVFTTLSLSNYWDASGQLAGLADELEDLASPEMNVILNNLGATQSKALVEETYFTTMNTFQVAKQGLDAAVGLSLSRGTEFREQLQLPKGAAGPDEDGETDWRFWAKYYGQFYHRGQQDLNPEYDAIMHGGVIGMDKSFGPLLIGISGGAGNYSIDTESDAEQNMNAFQAALYSTIGKGHSYLDAGLAYGANSVESHTAAPLKLDSEFDTQLISAHLGGGIGFELPSIGTIITPEAAVRYTAYQQDAYTEKSDVAVARSFDEFDADSLTGTFGLNAAMLNTSALESFAFKIEGRAHWIREFNPEPGDASYQLVGGTDDYIIAYPFLDEDTIRLGVGFTFFNTKRNSQENVLLRIDFDELFGEDFNSHNLSAKVIYAF